jgi:predicted ATPase
MRARRSSGLYTYGVRGSGKIRDMKGFTFDVESCVLDEHEYHAFAILVHHEVQLITQHELSCDLAQISREQGLLSCDRFQLKCNRMWRTEVR